MSNVIPTPNTHTDYVNHDMYTVTSFVTYFKNSILNVKCLYKNYGHPGLGFFQPDGFVYWFLLM